MPQLTDAAVSHSAADNSSQSPRTERNVSRHLLTATLALLFVVLSIYLLDRLASILQPLIIACFLLYALYPVKEWLKRRGLATWVSYSLIALFVLALLGILGTLAYRNLDQLSPDRLAEYEATFNQQLNSWLRSVGVNLEEDVTISRFLYSEQGLNERFRGAIVALSGSFLNFLTASAIVLVYMLFLVLEMSDLRERVRDAFGPEKADATFDTAKKVNDVVGGYISVMVFVSVLQGALSAAVLGMLGVEFWLLWGVVIGLLNFVPYLGLVGVAVPIVVAFLQFPEEPWRALVVLVLLSGIQATVDNVIRTRMMGEKLSISPLLILLSLAFWGWLWGAVGLILAVPLTVTLKIILEHIPTTRPIALLMKNK